MSSPTCARTALCSPTRGTSRVMLEQPDRTRSRPPAARARSARRSASARRTALRLTCARSSLLSPTRVIGRPLVLLPQSRSRPADAVVCLCSLCACFSRAHVRVDRPQTIHDLHLTIVRFRYPETRRCLLPSCDTHIRISSVPSAVPLLFLLLYPPLPPVCGRVLCCASLARCSFHCCSLCNDAGWSMNGDGDYGSE